MWMKFKVFIVSSVLKATLLLRAVAALVRGFFSGRRR